MSSILAKSNPSLNMEYAQMSWCGGWGGGGGGKFCQISLYKRLLHIYLFNIMNDQGFFLFVCFVLFFKTA